MGLREIAQVLNRALSAESAMTIGEVVWHPKGYRVKVIGGMFLDPIYGRVSNWWSWRRVQPSGRLGKKESGYGWTNAAAAEGKRLAAKKRRKRR